MKKALCDIILEQIKAHDIQGNVVEELKISVPLFKRLIDELKSENDFKEVAIRLNGIKRTAMKSYPANELRLIARKANSVN